MNDTNDEKRRLLSNLQEAEGTLEEKERWVSRLRELDSDFYSSDFGIQLETSIRGLRKAQELMEQKESRLTRGDLVDLVRKLQNGEGTEEEEHAWLTLLISRVQDPNISDLIYWSDEQLSAEEIIDRAMMNNPS